MTISRHTPEDAQAIVEAARAEINRVVERARRELAALTQRPLPEPSAQMKTAADNLAELSRHAETDLRGLTDDVESPPPTDRARSARGPTASAEASAALRREMAVWEEERRPQPAARPAWPPSPGATPPRDRRIAVALGLVLVASIGIGAAVWFTRSRPSSRAETSPAAPTPAVEGVLAPVEPPTEVLPTPPAAPLVVRWETRRTSWIQATVDGETDGGALYEAGQSRTIEANGEIRLRIGDAGAVLVSVNNEPPIALGSDGQVVNRRFAAAPQP